LLREQASKQKRVNDENLLERFFVFSHKKLRKKQKLFFDFNLIFHVLLSLKFVNKSVGNYKAINCSVQTA